MTNAIPCIENVFQAQTVKTKSKHFYQHNIKKKSSPPTKLECHIVTTSTIEGSNSQNILKILQWLDNSIIW